MKLLDWKHPANDTLAEQGSSASPIVVLMDGSPAAQVGATVAIQFARGQSLPIRGVYVIDEVLVLDSYSNYQNELTHAGEPQTTGELVEWFRQQGEHALQWLEIQCIRANVPVETEIVFGGMPDVILRRESQALLLSLGRQGRTRADKPASLGHNFRAIAHHSHIPLLVGGRDQHPIRKILLVYDLGKDAELALSWSIRLQRSLNATLTVLTSNKNGHDPYGLESKFDQRGVDGYGLMIGEQLSAGKITDVAAICQADLIVMDGVGRNALLTRIAGSTVEHVLQQTTIPVLVA